MNRAPFVQAKTTGSFGEPGTCDQLGVCQNNRPRCSNCPEYLDDAESEAPLTPLGHAGYLAAMAGLLVTSIATVGLAVEFVFSLL